MWWFKKAMYLNNWSNNLPGTNTWPPIPPEFPTTWPQSWPVNPSVNLGVLPTQRSPYWS
jgi:hypothetical protein